MAIMVMLLLILMDIVMSNSDVENHASLRLFQLISPSLPIGSFTYSQGLEWAYEAGWLNDAEAMEQWLLDLIQTALKNLEIPVLIRLIDAWQQQDKSAIKHWNEYLLASRESAEFKQEEINRGRAMAVILSTLAPFDDALKPLITATQTSAFAYACVQWHIDKKQACFGFIWSWIENSVLAAVKIIPLGQTQGQLSLFRLAQHSDTIYNQALTLADEEIGNSSFALAIASAQHETQYTRLYRS